MLTNEFYLGIVIVFLAFLSKDVNCATLSYGLLSSEIFDGYKPRPDKINVNSKKVLTNNGEYPYVAAIFYKTWKPGNGLVNEHWCGSVIIRDDVLLTAGHCLRVYADYEIKNFTVIAGTSNIGSRPNESLQKRKVKSIKVHEDYDYFTLRNDIGLIFLDKPLKFNKFVRNLTLPTRGQYDTFIGEHVRVMGWGESNNLSRSDDLKIVDVRVKPRDDCYFGQPMKNNTMCLKSDNGKGFTGHSDSGGPAVLNYSKNPKEHLLAGICSHDGLKKVDGTDVMVPVFGAAYVDIAAMRPWIDRQLANKDSQLKLIV